MKTFGELHIRNARLYPDKVAWVCGDKRMTFATYLDRCRRLGSAMERAGAIHQDRIGIFAANSLEYFEYYGACEIAGFIAAVYNFRAAPPELAHLLQDSAPSILIFDADFIPIVDAVRERATHIKRFVCIGESGPDWATSFEEFLTEGDQRGAVSISTNADYVYLFYTSGTTGRPKGVPQSHRGALTTAQRTANCEDMSLLQITPAFHTGGRGPAQGAQWVAGKVVVQRGFDATAFLETVQAERINTCFLVPAMMQALLDHPEIDRYDLTSLAYVMAASTAIPTGLLTRAIERLGPVFYIAYGSTEAGGVTRLRRSETRADGPPIMLKRLASVGHPETPVDVKIMDDQGTILPDGEVGEICVISYCFEGYWNNPAATAETMHGEYLKTGDLGYLDENGYLFLVDRKKDMIITGGENVYSREVEDALIGHASVRAAAVIGAPDARWGERIVAVLVAEPGQTIDPPHLLAYVHTRIAKFKCPKDLIVVDALPLLGSGKIDKLTLRTRYADTAG